MHTFFRRWHSNLLLMAVLVTPAHAVADSGMGAFGQSIGLILQGVPIIAVILSIGSLLWAAFLGFWFTRVWALVNFIVSVYGLYYMNVVLGAPAAYPDTELVFTLLISAGALGSAVMLLLVQLVVFGG